MSPSKTLYNQTWGKLQLGSGAVAFLAGMMRKSITCKSSSSNGSTERVSSKERLRWWSIKISVEDWKKFSPFKLGYLSPLFHFTSSHSGLKSPLYDGDKSLETFYKCLSFTL